MVLLSWIGLIKSAKQPGKLFWQAARGSELHEHLQYFLLNGINGSVGPVLSTPLHYFIWCFSLLSRQRVQPAFATNQACWIIPFH